MIKLYGSRPTRSTRAAWMLEELGLEYELIDRFDPRSAEFLGHNPNGKLPTLVDDGFAVWESMAVNLYLAQKYGGPLWPAGLEDQTRANMWSYWAMTELEQPLHTMIGARRRDPQAAAELASSSSGATDSAISPPSRRSTPGSAAARNDRQPSGWRSSR